MVLVGAAIVPHGDFAYAPELLPLDSASRAAAEDIHDSVAKLARELHLLGDEDDDDEISDFRLKVDAIFVTTPHGLALCDSHALYANTMFDGKCVLGGDVIQHDLNSQTSKKHKSDSGSRNDDTYESDDDYIIVNKPDINGDRDDTNSTRKEVKISLKGHSSHRINDALLDVLSMNEGDLEDSCRSKSYHTGKKEGLGTNNSHAAVRPKLVQSLLAFNDSQPLQLQWGEIVPLACLLKKNDVATNDNIRNLTSGIPTTGIIDHFHLPCEISVLSISSRRYTQSGQMCDELLQLGGKIAQALEDLKDLRIFWMVSCDLAHTHSADGPYGYRPAAARFDRFAGEWVRSYNRKKVADNNSTVRPTTQRVKLSRDVMMTSSARLRYNNKEMDELDESVVIRDEGDKDSNGSITNINEEGLFSTLTLCGDRTLLLKHCKREQEDEAMSCGFTGLVMLQGAMEVIAAQNKSQCHADEDEIDYSCWSSELLANINPTYYGMMVARFHRKGYP